MSALGRPIATRLERPLADLRIWGGTLLTPLRLIVGWTYFSAFWRRLVLENKLLPGEPGYIGEKFNHFLPNALGIGPIIEFFVSHPELLWWKLVAFTIVEGVVGLALMAGLLTRAMGVATSLLALGILLGAGWLGTTCLDEWQIGVLGIGGGLAFAYAGGGRYSADYLLARRFGAGKPGLLSWARGVAPSEAPIMGKLVIVSSVAAFGLTLLTNQVFHNGVWGDLHNKSVRPVVELSEAEVRGDELKVRLYRVEGADVYGSFAIGLRLLDDAGAIVAEWSADELSRLPDDAIDNHYVARIQPGTHSLVLPLGAKADVSLRHPELTQLGAGDYRVELLDISGLSWTTPLQVGSKHVPTGNLDDGRRE
ncbi:TQO small subunit DoxD [Tautonia sp. JC769]|uniref:TQO small subunit DoxD n=1 Tax=Tautonia sp. JC769 TaxID=3232135 RepID=UPI003459B07E